MKLSDYKKAKDIRFQIKEIEDNLSTMERVVSIQLVLDNRGIFPLDKFDLNHEEATKEEESIESIKKDFIEGIKFVLNIRKNVLLSKFEAL
jgi:hypothetical protein